MTEIRLIKALQKLQNEVSEVSKKEGPRGERGLPGADGRDGKDGYTPVKGVDYFDGKDGCDGINGRDGRDGIDGRDGRDGSNGRDGIDGLPGKDGVNGIDGVGIAKAEIKKDHLIITLTDGKVIDCGYVRGPSGFPISVADAFIKRNHLFIKLTNGKEIDVGSVSGGGTGGGVNDVLVNDVSVVDGDTAVIDLTPYAKTEDIPDLNGYATEKWVDEQGYAKEVDIPTVPEDVSAFNNDVGYITKADVPTVPTKTSELTNDSGYITENDIPEIPTVPDKVSAFENDAGYITDSDINNKYDKTGGNISGNVDVDGTMTLNIDDEDYDAGVKLVAKPLDTNRGTILKLQGFANSEAENTNYKVVLENIGTPVNDNDAATKKYVDDKTSITWITGFYDEQGLYVASSAYNDCYNGITSNHTVYLKVTEASQVSILRLKSWLNFNDHSSGGDSFFFVDAIDLSTNKTATISKNSATFNSLNLEMIDNKKTGVEANKDSDVFYPTTKATYDFVQDEFDRRKPVLIYDKTEKLKVAGTITPNLDSDNGLLATGNSGYTDKYNITGLDLSKFREIKFVYLRDTTNTGTTAEFIIPLDYPIQNKKTGVGATDYETQYVASGSTLSFGDRNRFNCCQASVCVPIGGTLENCSISVNQYFSLYGTAATTLNSDIYVVRIYGIY